MKATLQTLVRKHKAAIAQSEHDLAHVTATIKILEGSEAGKQTCIASTGLFAKAEM